MGNYEQAKRNFSLDYPQFIEDALQMEIEIKWRVSNLKAEIKKPPKGYSNPLRGFT